MQLDPTQRRTVEIFLPYYLEKHERAEAAKTRFVHYTSADVLMSILRTRRMWMRNALTMNDYSEIAHGRECLATAYDQRPVGEQFRKLMDEVHPGISADIVSLFNSNLTHLHQRTFITCLSEHNPELPEKRLFDEDRFGRLSMWRAYGGANGAALVLNPFLDKLRTGQQSIVISPVAYLDVDGFVAQFQKVTDNVAANRDFLKGLPREGLRQLVSNVFRYAVLSTKHVGFAEEREWRVIYSPSLGASDFVETEFESIRGVPQTVHKLKLENDPAKDIHNSELAYLIDRIVIGPTTQPLTLLQTFVELLEQLKVPEPGQRVYASLLPLRQF